MSASGGVHGLGVPGPVGHGPGGHGPVGQALHLARRFFGSLSRAEPAVADRAWVESVLLPGERALWARMSPADRRHHVGVGRAVQAALGGGGPAGVGGARGAGGADGPERAVLAAALLHDIGKVESGLGTFSRVAATIVGQPPVRRRSAALASRSGPVGRLGRYLQHPEIGERLLTEAGSERLTAAWAGSHHRPEERWDPVVPVAAGRVLKAADDD